MPLVDNAWYISGKTGIAVTNIGTNGNTAGATVTIAAVTVPAGALIVFAACESSNAAASGTFSDGGTNSYSTATSNTVNGTVGFTTIFYVANALALNNATFTYTKNINGGNASVTAFYATGIATSTPLDGAVTAIATGSSTAPSVTSGVPATNGELLVGYSASNSSGGTTFTNSATTGFVTPFTTANAVPSCTQGGGNLNVGTTSAITFAGTLSNSSPWTAFIIGFKPAAAPTGWWAVTQWSNHTAVAGEIIRQATIPAVGNERIFVCTTAGATGAVEPTWSVTRGALNTSSSAVYQECTGVAGINGDLTNTPNWTTVKNTAIVLGQVIQRNSAASYQICTVAGTAGNGAEPAFSNTAGTTTADNTVTWTSLGAVGNFTGWQAPHARLANSFAANWGQAGNKFFVGDNHAENQISALTLTCPGTAGSPCFIYDVDHTASVPPGTGNLKTTATITQMGNFAFKIVATYAYFYGLAFIQSAGAASQILTVASGAANAYDMRFEACSMQQLSTGGAQTIALGFSSGNRGGRVVFNNTTVQFAQAGGFIVPACVYFYWYNTPSAVAGTAPTVLFDAAATNDIQSIVVMQGVDLSAITGTVVGAGLTYTQWKLINCKLAGGVTVAAAASIVANFASAAQVDNIVSDSTGTNYQQQRYRFQGTLLSETAIVRSGGASDGITAISHKIATTANSFWVSPFESFPIAIWNSKVAATVTATLYGIVNGAAVPNNDDIWSEVEYLGTLATPLGAFASNTKANNLAVGSALTADASAWDSLVAARANSTGYALGNAIKVASNPGRVFFCTAAGSTAGSEPGGYASAVDGGSVTDNTATFRAGCRFTMPVALSAPQPQLIGYIYATVKAAKPSTTFYIDPLIQLS